MQGQAPVIDYLKELLRGELAARDQYFLHSRMYADWGFSKLYERINHEMEEETQHADALLQRILFLEGTPDMTPEPINPGHTVPDMLRNDLALEYKVRAALAQGIALAEQHGDYPTRHAGAAAARHRGRPRLLAGAAARPDRPHRSAELPAIPGQLSLPPRGRACLARFRQSRKRLTIDCN